MTIADMIDIERIGCEPTKDNVDERLRVLTNMLVQVAEKTSRVEEDLNVQK